MGRRTDAFRKRHRNLRSRQRAPLVNGLCALIDLIGRAEHVTVYIADVPIPTYHHGHTYFSFQSSGNH